MLDNVAQVLIPLVIFLFVIWLVYRIENRIARKTIYRNFPFFKDAVENFQQKIDNLNSRLDFLEGKIRTMQREKKDPGV